MAFADTDKMQDMIAQAYNARVGVKGGYRTETLTGAATLDYTYPSIIGLDPGGAGRTVTLDGSAAADPAIDGLMRIIINTADAAEDLTIEDQAAGSVGTISQNEMGLFFHDGQDGWTLAFVVTGTLA